MARRRPKISSRRERIAEFHAELGRLGCGSYREYLAGAHWADVRARFMASGLAKEQCCAGCGTSNTLSLHPRTYQRIGKEWLGDLILVCRCCHEAIHRKEFERGIHVWGATKGALREVRKARALEGRAVK